MHVLILEQEKDVESIKQSLIEGYENSFWTCSNSKLGYSGTAIISRVCLFFQGFRRGLSYVWSLEYFAPLRMESMPPFYLPFLFIH